MAQRLNAPDQEGVFHFVTLNVRDRKAAFRREEDALAILRLLRFECDRHPAQLIAYVVMPNHLHFIFLPHDGKVSRFLSRFLSRFKANATRNVDELAELQGRDKVRLWLNEKGKRELWQDGKYSLPLYSPEWMREKIEYIHDNPVRAGLSSNAANYAFSSFGAYFPEYGVVPPVKVDVREI